MPSAEAGRRSTRTCARTSSGSPCATTRARPSTLCAGCGHDSVTAAIVRAFYELDTPPHMIAKLSGIGCSSKTPTYFVGGAHGFNSAHGRMPSIATGANAANRELTYIGISGDGDSLSIGIGQLVHAIRRNLDMLYVIENNGVYGLTKGQFSASADVGSKSKRGEANQFSPIDPVSLALELGATLRRPQLLRRQGAAGPHPQGGPVAQGLRAHRRHLPLRDLQRPRGVDQELPPHAQAHAPGGRRRLRARFARSEITADYAPGSAVSVQLHDGSTVRLRKLADDYDPADRQAAAAEVERHRGQGRGRDRPASSSTPSPATCTTSAAPPTCRSRSCPSRSSAPAAPPSTSSRRASASQARGRSGRPGRRTPLGGSRRSCS